MIVVSREEIERALDFPSLIPALKAGFVDFFHGQAVVAPITNIDVPESNGEMHIKPGYLTSSDNLCVKVVTCFYDNPGRGLPTRDGAILVADRRDGRMKAVLADAGLITDMRTAGSSAVAVDALTVPGAISLGLVGAGTQAFWHAAAIKAVRPVADVRVWGRDPLKAGQAAARIERELGVPARACDLAGTILCDVVVTATPAQHPVLTEGVLKPDALIVAMGADAVGKRELGAGVIRQVGTLVVDSRDQCRRYGELQWLDAGAEHLEILELGALLAGTQTRPTAGGLVVFDSTGVAFQDAVGAEIVLRNLDRRAISA